MGQLALPFAGISADIGSSFEISNSAGGVAVQGNSTGADQSGYGGTGVLGVAGFGGVGVNGTSNGFDRDHNPGVGVQGVAESGGTAVLGISSGYSPEQDDSGQLLRVPGIGVTGICTNGGIGIKGESSRTAESQPGIGVSGHSALGVGVRGSSDEGFAMQALGTVIQSRDKSGWVKALAHLAFTNEKILDIVSHFNSQGAQIQRIYVDIGVYIIDFGFQVNDRYVLVQPISGDIGDPTIGDAAFYNFVLAGVSFPTPTQVRVTTWIPVVKLGQFVGFSPANKSFFIVVL